MINDRVHPWCRALALAVALIVAACSDSEPTDPGASADGVDTNEQLTESGEDDGDGGGDGDGNSDEGEADQTTGGDGTQGPGALEEGEEEEGTGPGG